MICALVVTVSVTPLAAQGSDPPQTIVYPTTGCRAQDDYWRLAGIGASGDAVAFRKFESVKTAVGACRIFDRGDKVFLVEVASLGRIGCLRPMGETDCYWVRSIHFRPN